MTNTDIQSVRIGRHSVGFGSPVFVIAEAGVNHNGDLDLARRLVIEAKEAGADCVKFQTFQAERVVTVDAPKAAYQLENTDAKESQLDMLRKLELSPEVYVDLIHLCKQMDIVFMSTPYNIEDVDFLDELGVAAFKLASIHVAEPYFIDYVARRGKPVILSTGMATVDEVSNAVQTFLRTGNQQLILLQCTTNYPSQPKDANLRAITTMRTEFGVPTGYSDHTETDVACVASIALGACVIEKHFTIDKSLPGPDQSSSANPQEFRSLVQRLKEVQIALGTGVKEPCEIERVNAIGMRRSIVARTRILSGEVIQADTLTFKRPATGLVPSLMEDVVGKVAALTIEPDQMLTWEMIRES